MILHPTPKINLGLNVLSEREDGYHDIETLFYPYRAISDTLVVEAAPELGKGGLDISVKIDGVPSPWLGEDDLCAKAYRLMAEKYGLGGVRIRLDKHIPVGAGLGGGSSDGSATIKALDSIFNLGLRVQEMLSIAGEIESDCPFFIIDSPCLAKGRGELLTPVDLDLKDYRIDLTIPEGVRVSTKEAYKGICCRVPEKHIEEIIKGDIQSWKTSLYNDFEKTVFKAHPSLAEAKQSIYESGALYASMSGSGSALFGIFKK